MTFIFFIVLSILPLCFGKKTTKLLPAEKLAGAFYLLFNATKGLTHQALSL